MHESRGLGDVYKRQLLHEAYHNKHMDDFELLKDKKIDCQSLLGTINNIAMDFKIETRNRGEFKGRDQLVKEARYAFAAEYIYRNLGEVDPKNPIDPLRDKLEAVWVHDALCRIEWIPEYEHDNLPGRMTPEGYGWLEKLLSYPALSQSYIDQTTAQDTYDVTLLILRALELDPEDPEVNQSPEGGEGEEGDEEASAAGDGSDAGEGSDETGKGKTKASGSAWVKFSEIVAADDHDPSSDRESSLHIEYDVAGNGQWIPMDFRDTDLDRGYPDLVNDNRVEKALRDMMQHCNLSKKIRRELQAITRTRFESGKRRGRLHKRSLHKSVNENAKLFKQRQVRFSPKATAVMLLQDWSGSMGRTKFKVASAATHEMARVLNSLQIPFAIQGYSTMSGWGSYGQGYNMDMRFKEFNEGWNADKFVHRCVVASHDMHCNADGDFILKAGAELLKHKATRKILFVLSDGSPAANDNHGNSDCDGFTKRVIEQLERVPGLEIYAIGIEDRNVERLYRHHASISRADELEDKLLSVLRHKIISQMS